MREFIIRWRRLQISQMYRTCIFGQDVGYESYDAKEPWWSGKTAIVFRIARGTVMGMVMGDVVFVLFLRNVFNRMKSMS